MKTSFYLLTAILFIALFSCQTKEKPEGEESMKTDPKLQERIDLYAPIEIKADLTRLTEKQKKLIKILTEAGHIADEIFWRQTSPDAVSVRDSLKKLNAPEAEQALKFVMINYGPYDRIDHEKRYVGEGPEHRPDGGTFYPIDMTKKEFEKYVENNPEQKEELESLYTVVVRDGDKLTAVPYSQAYPEIERLANKLKEAAKFAENESLKKYLLERAKALKTDEYFDSDVAWMEIEDNDIDVIIGPIESYEDALFNYKTAFEAVVMVKDLEATENFALFKKYIKDFENNLPYEDKKYIREEVGKGTQINFVNAAYFGGDCQAGIKTIACSLPNDPKVRKLKGGGKNTMYKNMMEAKFEKIVVPIANVLLTKEQAKMANKTSFVNFVTLHELGHTLGRGNVYGKDITIKKALQEAYSPIEEVKADILAIYNQELLNEKGVISDEELRSALCTYLPGLFRSIRFGAGEAHGKANLIQFNFLREAGAIDKNEDGKFVINEDVFFEKAGKLANLILTTEAEGNYEKAKEILKKYGKVTEEIKQTIENLSDIPRDIDTSYEF